MSDKKPDPAIVLASHINHHILLYPKHAIADAKTIAENNHRIINNIQHHSDQFEKATENYEQTNQRIADCTTSVGIITTDGLTALKSTRFLMRHALASSQKQGFLDAKCNPRKR